MRARAAVAADGPHRDDGAVFVPLGAGRLEQLGDGPLDAFGILVRHETTFDDGSRRPETHPARVCPGTAEEMEAGHHHRLSGACLTGEYCQAFVELRGRLGDHTEVVDPDLCQHV